MNMHFEVGVTFKMKPIILIVIYTILFLIVFTRGNEKEALVFDRFDRSLYDLPDDIPYDMKCGAWATACPAETSAELDFVEKYSFTKNALFVKEIYERGRKASEVNKDLCRKTFKLSLTYNVRSSTFQFGFEIYFKLRDAEYFHDYNADDYKSPKEAAENMSTFLSKTKFVAGEYKRIMQNAVDVNVKELWFNNDRKMKFTWIYLVKFGFDTSTMILRTMAYDINANSRWPVKDEQCEDFTLGDELYRGFDVDNAYHNKNKNIFEQFKLPSSLKCASNEECFQKLPIIPIDQFRFGFSSSLSCSNMATIPVWIGDAEMFLKKVDQYLYALYRVKNDSFHIIAGVSDKHVFPKKGSWRGKSTLYLDSQKKKIPIPKIIFKMVEYHVKDCTTDENRCWYSCIIIIHNDPFFKPADKICSKDVTEDWGWKGIKSTDPKQSEIIYVCPRNDGVMRKLFGFGGYKTSIVFQDLILSRFPYSVGGSKKDIVKDVDKMFAELKANGEDLMLAKKKVLKLDQSNVGSPDDTTLLSSRGTEGSEQSEGGND